MDGDASKDPMSTPDDQPSVIEKRPFWHFLVALVVVVGGVAVGTLLIIPRADRPRSRPAVTQPAPTGQPPTNAVVPPANQPPVKN